jgi:hypothetical protein
MRPCQCMHHFLAIPDIILESQTALFGEKTQEQVLCVMNESKSNCLVPGGAKMGFGKCRSPIVWRRQVCFPLLPDRLGTAKEHLCGSAMRVKDSWALARLN